MDVNVPAVVERSADLTFDLSSADLRIAGGAADLVEGHLTYAPGDPKPEVAVASKESTAGKVATVALKQGVPAAGGGGRLWDLKLNGGLPADVTVTQKSGALDLDLGLVDVKDLAVSSESGRVRVKLAGPHPSMSHASIDARSGGVAVDASGEYPALEGLDVSSSSGDVYMDLAGTWRKDFTAKVEAKSGDVVLTLPEKINTRVVASTSSGDVSAGGFVQDAGAWTHAPAQPSPFTLTVEVRVMSGDVELKLR